MSVLRFGGNNQCQAPRSGRRYLNALNHTGFYNHNMRFYRWRQNESIQALFFTSNHRLGKETIPRKSALKDAFKLTIRNLAGSTIPIAIDFENSILQMTRHKSALKYGLYLQ